MKLSQLQYQEKEIAKREKAIIKTLAKQNTKQSKQLLQAFLTLPKQASKANNSLSQAPNYNNKQSNNYKTINLNEYATTNRTTSNSIKTSDYVSFLSGNNESEEIKIYNYIYDTYDTIKLEIMKEKTSATWRLELLEARLNRKLDAYIVRQQQTIELQTNGTYAKKENYKTCQANTILQWIIVDSLRGSTKREELKDNVQYEDKQNKTQLDRLEIKYTIKAIIDSIGISNYNFLNSYYKDKEANDYDNKKTCKKNRLVKQLKAKMQHIID